MEVPDYVGILPCEQAPGECGCNCVEIVIPSLRGPPRHTGAVLATANEGYGSIIKSTVNISKIKVKNVPETKTPIL